MDSYAEKPSKLNSNLTQYKTSVKTWTSISSPVTMGSIVSANAIVIEINSDLKMVRIYGNITTNAAVNANTNYNLLQIVNAAYWPLHLIPVTFYNNNKVNNCGGSINTSGQIRLHDITAINGPVVLYIDAMYQYA